MKQISSAQNPKLKLALRLHESRGRRQQGRIVIFGSAEVRRAVEARIDIDELFICPEILSGEMKQVAEELDCSNHTPVFQLPADLFEKLAFGQRSDGIVAIANRPKTEIDAFSPSKQSLVLVLESIEKPGNLGAVYRSACAAGVDAVFLANPVCDAFHPNAIRASLGTVFSIPSYCANSEQIKQLLVENQFMIVSTRVDATTRFTEANLADLTAIVLGNESQGLSQTWSGDEIFAVTIPMNEGVDSLNIAMTSTLMVFESRRQREAREGN